MAIKGRKNITAVIMIRIRKKKKTCIALPVCGEYLMK